MCRSSRGTVRSNHSNFRISRIYSRSNYLAGSLATHNFRFFAREWLLGDFVLSQQLTSTKRRTPRVTVRAPNS